MTLSELIASHLGSPAFLRLAAETQKSQRGVYRRLVTRMDDPDILTITHDVVQTLIGELAHRPGKAANMLDRLRTLMRLAEARGLVSSDPTRHVKRYALGTRHTWTDVEIAQFKRRWPRGSDEVFRYRLTFRHMAPAEITGAMIRQAFDLLLHLGQRRADIVKLMWSDVRADAVFVKQQKTGRELWLPIPDIFNGAPRGNGAVLMNQSGNAFSSAEFSNMMAAAIAAAALPKRCTPHGLRKAMCRRLAEAGCTANEIQAMSGHSTLKEVARYTAAVDQTRLARAAVQKLEGR